MTHLSDHRTRQTALPTALSCFALLLAACGGGETADAPPSDTPAAPQGIYGSAPSAAGGTPSVIMLRPIGSTVALPPREAPVMDQLGLAFSPALLLVRLAETASFTNSETITHNVRLAFSDNDSTVLDAETDPGAHADFLFDREGGYEVTCDHHPGMRAFVFVTSAPYVVFADHAGAFRLADVPPGSYTLAVWSVDAARRSEQALEVAGPSTEVVLSPAL